MNDDEESNLRIENDSSIKKHLNQYSNSHRKQNRLYKKWPNFSHFVLKNKNGLYKILFVTFTLILIILFCQILFENQKQKQKVSKTLQNQHQIQQQNNVKKKTEVKSLDYSDQQSNDIEQSREDYNPLSQSIKSDTHLQAGTQPSSINNQQMLHINPHQLVQIPNFYSQNYIYSKDQEYQLKNKQNSNFSQFNKQSHQISDKKIYQKLKQLRQQQLKQFYRRQQLQKAQKINQNAQFQQNVLNTNLIKQGNSAHQIQVARQKRLKQLNQKKDLQRHRKRKTKNKNQVQNILKNITKNPYLDDQYANISKADIERVKKWRYFLTLQLNQTNSISQQQYQYYQKKYNIDKYEELPFCLVIPTFNNLPRKRFLKNIISVIMQNYTNYHFVVIDDGSTDGTGERIQHFLKKQQSKIPSYRYKVVILKERHFAMPNLRWAAKNFCKPQDIFMIVDGDDQLLGRQVLKLFNSVFQEKKVWFMYTNFLSSQGKLGYSRPYHPQIIQDNDYRNFTFAVSHLRAYYTQLFLNIKEEDLQNQNGTYFTSANDMAICIPALQQSHTRIAYIPQITYFYNINTGQNVHKDRLQEQRRNNLRIRAKQRYSPLQDLFKQNQV